MPYYCTFSNRFIIFNIPLNSYTKGARNKDGFTRPVIITSALFSNASNIPSMPKYALAETISPLIF